jgi:hypothetical protein
MFANLPARAQRTALALTGRWPVAAALALAVAVTLYGIRLRAATAEERTVVAPQQALLDGLAKHDRTAVRDQLLPGGMATVSRFNFTSTCLSNDYQDPAKPERSKSAFSLQWSG